MNYKFTPRFSPEAIKQLVGYHWPGNVRELQNVIERAIIINQTGLLSFDNMLSPPIECSDAKTAPPKTMENFLTIDDMIVVHIKDCLKLTKGRIEGEGGAAELLGLNPSTLRSKMRKLGIQFGRGHAY